MKLMKSLLIVSLFLMPALKAAAGEESNMKFMDAQIEVMKSIQSLELKANPALKAADGSYKDQQNHGPLFQVFMCINTETYSNELMNCVSDVYTEVLNAAAEEIAKENTDAAKVVSILKTKAPELFEKQDVKTIPAMQTCQGAILVAQKNGHYSAQDIKQAIALGKIAADLNTAFFNDVNPGFCGK